MTRAELQSIYSDFAERCGHDIARRVVRWRAMTGSTSLNSAHPSNYAALARAFADVAAGRDRLAAYKPPPTIAYSGAQFRRTVDSLATLSPSSFERSLPW